MRSAKAGAWGAWLEAHKPAAKSRWHLTAAALMWTGAGTGLAVAGAVQTLRNVPGSLVPAALFGIAGVAGAAKGRFVLSRTARRNAQRIRERGESRCLGGFLSLRGWLLVIVMMGLGRLLRRSGLSWEILGPIYLTVGLGLLIGSFSLWRARARAAANGSSRGEPGPPMRA